MGYREEEEVKKGIGYLGYMKKKKSSFQSNPQNWVTEQSTEKQ